jgi:uncharacterized heparinase superfamily protein
MPIGRRSGEQGAAVAWGPDRWRLYRLALRESGRALGSALRRFARRPRFLYPSPGRLLLAPQDLRTSDATVASDIYAGLFVFAGRALSTGGRSPFDVEPPSEAWSEALFGFGWLRHLRAADSALARANARALVDDFLARRRPRKHVSRRPPVVARRVISFLEQSPLLLSGADYPFYGRLVRSIRNGVRDLEAEMHGASRPLDRLSAAIALCYAGLCCEGFDSVFRRGTRGLARELARQILPDGGHVSRNPQVVLDLLLDLLPLRQIYAGRGVEPPEDLLHGIDRMLPFLRVLREGDGTLAHFNGMGLTAVDHLSTLLMYEGARGQGMRRAPHSGYERLEAGGTVVVADVGAAPRPESAAEAHAGCLAFELSSGPDRIVVNCGAALGRGEEARIAARSTSAHSTLTLDDTSSGRFLVPQGWWADRVMASWLVRRLGAVLIRGPGDTAVEREDRAEAVLLRASHDGYAAPFGVAHERRWRLSGDGGRLDGEDVLTPHPTAAAEAEVKVRFHLHPRVKATPLPGAGAMMLLLPNGEAWDFRAEGLKASLEDSVYFAATEGVRRTDQIVLSFGAGERPGVKWRFERTSGPR